MVDVQIEIDMSALTSLEIRILEGLANGLQSKEIAINIERSVATVEFYVRALYLKMRARSRAHLVALGYQRGFLKLDIAVATRISSFANQKY